MEKEMGVGMGMDTKMNINEGRVQVDDGDQGSEFMDGAGNVCYSYGTSYSRILLLCSYSYATTLGWLGAHQTSNCFFVCPLPWMIR